MYRPSLWLYFYHAQLFCTRNLQYFHWLSYSLCLQMYSVYIGFYYLTNVYDHQQWLHFTILAFILVVCIVWDWFCHKSASIILEPATSPGPKNCQNCIWANSSYTRTATARQQTRFAPFHSSTTLHRPGALFTVEMHSGLGRVLIICFLLANGIFWSHSRITSLRSQPSASSSLRRRSYDGLASQSSVDFLSTPVVDAQANIEVHIQLYTSVWILMWCLLVFPALRLIRRSMQACPRRLRSQSDIPIYPISPSIFLLHAGPPNTYIHWPNLLAHILILNSRYKCLRFLLSQPRNASWTSWLGRERCWSDLFSVRKWLSWCVFNFLSNACWFW